MINSFLSAGAEAPADWLGVNRAGIDRAVVDEEVFVVRLGEIENNVGWSSFGGGETFFRSERVVHEVEDDGVSVMGHLLSPFVLVRC